MVTNKNLYMMTPTKGKFNFNRKVSLELLGGITESIDERNPEVILHISQDYDERLNVGEHRAHIVRILLLIGE